LLKLRDDGFTAVERASDLGLLGLPVALSQGNESDTWNPDRARAEPKPRLERD
jgi:hypothetical protein